MLRFILTRVSLIVPTFIGITLLVFVLIRLIPGDPIETMAGERGLDAALHAKLRHEYGFDQPVLLQYWYYLLRREPETIWPAASTIGALFDREGLTVRRQADRGLGPTVGRTRTGPWPATGRARQPAHRCGHTATGRS